MPVINIKQITTRENADNSGIIRKFILKSNRINF